MSVLYEIDVSKLKMCESREMAGKVCEQCAFVTSSDSQLLTHIPPVTRFFFERQLK